MPICGCVESCNCTVAQDGYWGNHPELGRNFSNVTGDGSSSDPFVITFLDSLEFRPRTAEIGWKDFSLVSTSSNFTPVSFTADQDSFLIYESPIHFVVRDPFSFEYRYSDFNYMYIGASVTFAETADASTNDRQIALANLYAEVFPATSHVIAASQSPGGNADPLTLTCEAFWPGIFLTVTGVGNVRQEFQLYVYQNSGSNIVLSDIKIWITEI